MSDHQTATPAPATLDDAAALLGVDALTDEQRTCGEAALAGRDVLAVLPTGAGKSAVYQTVAAVVDGPTVVVSPLLALVADQRDAIDRSSLPSSRAIDGETSAADRAQILADLADGSAEFLFVTPETLIDDDLRAGLAAAHPSLFVVDEAHCVVHWGHGFRPAYLELGEARRSLGSPPCIALTASADPRVRDDLVRLLGLDDPCVLVGELVRPGIELELCRFSATDDAECALLDDLAADDAKTLVYVATRALAERVAAELADRGRRAAHFHGGLGADRRAEVLHDFRGDRCDVVVATTAFGMGIDIADIRVVAHLDLPGSLIDYYQEVGRAGRDRRGARAVAYVGTDRVSRRAFSGGVRSISAQECQAVFSAIAAGAASKAEVRRRTNLSSGKVTRAITVLELASLVVTSPELHPATAGAVEPAEIARLCAEREEFDRSQRQAVDDYVASEHCRWALVLAALGETTDRCERCDRCRRSTEPRRVADTASTEDAEADDQRVGADLDHDRFGPGRVVALEGGVARVAFERVGPKTLDLDHCLAEGVATMVPG